MVAVAGDSVVYIVFQVAAFTVPSPETAEETEVPENTLRVTQICVYDIECERNVVDGAIGPNEYDSPIDDIGG